MEHHNCLNCGKPVVDYFCSHCGQRTNTHRINLKHFFLHDILHGVWHFERGILFTLRETFVRPGQAALDYISGKRIRYYNVFYLILLVIGLNITLAHLYESYLPQDAHEDLPKFLTFISDNVKYILIGWVPFLALNGYVIMDRMHLNVAEHLILAGVSLLGSLVIAIPWFFTDFLMDSGYDNLFMNGIQTVLSLCMFGFPIYAYCNAAKKKYRWWEYAWRFIIFYIFMIFEMTIFLTIVFFANGGLDAIKHLKH